MVSLAGWKNDHGRWSAVTRREAAAGDPRGFRNYEDDDDDEGIGFSFCIPILKPCKEAAPPTTLSTKEWRDRPGGGTVCSTRLK